MTTVTTPRSSAPANDPERDPQSRQVPVRSFNEWDPLEEVIVGVIDGAMVPTWDSSLDATMPAASRDFFLAHAGRPFPSELVDPARRELDAFARRLEREGVRVRRPEVVDHARPFETPDWRCAAGLYAAMPRDTLLCIGDEIIEVPMAWRSRYHETTPYRPLLKEYFEAGARWSAAPKPELCDAQFDPDFTEPTDPNDMRYVVTEYEPTFDAADFTRCGRDIFAQRSHVTNAFGIEWLRRHLGDDYRVHVLAFDDLHPMHIDATLVPLAPGRVLVNPDRVKALPDLFRDWEVLEAPAPAHRPGDTNYMCSAWISMNVLMLDPQRVCVEETETPLIDAFRRWGFEPVPCALRNFNTFGGGFHCCTLDVRRTGTLESYF